MSWKQKHYISIKIVLHDLKMINAKRRARALEVSLRNPTQDGGSSSCPLSQII